MPTKRTLTDEPAETSADFIALMEAVVDAIVVIEASGRIVAFSRAAEKMFGCETADILGQPVTCLMPEPYRSDHGGYIDRYLETGNAHVIGIGREVDALRSDGTIFPVWLSVGEIKSGSRRRFVGIIRDLTEQRRAEREQHAVDARLAHVSRLSLLGEMAAGIAHEINQPLSAISNYARAAEKLIERGDHDDATLGSACRGIAEQVERASEVILNLRKLVREREVEKASLRLKDVIESVMMLVTADATNAGITVETEISENLPPVSGNSVQLQQVLLNLTRNAIDAMRDLKRPIKSMRIETRKGDNGTVEFLVFDRGNGIPPNLEEAIFHPFFTTKPDGLGVGLAISRSIIEAHGGRLVYERRPGGGSVFCVSLPEIQAQ